MAKTLQVRMSEEDYGLLVERAGGGGKRLSEYCRLTLLRKEDAVQDPEPSKAVKRVEEQIEAVREKKAPRPLATRALCQRCSRIGVPSCPVCIAAAAKVAPSATETFGEME